MRFVVVEPVAPTLTWEDAEVHLKLDGDTFFQTEVEGFIAAIWEHLSGPDGWLGRNLAVEIVDLWLDCFDDITLPLGPVQSVAMVECRSPATGIMLAVDPATYQLRGDVLAPAWRQHWPVPDSSSECVHIRYDAGYPALPKAIRAAMLLMLDDLFRNRGSVETGVRAAAVEIPMSTTVINLLTPKRLWF